MRRTIGARCGAALLAALCADAAAAGAWTQAPGAGFVSFGANYYATDGGTYEETATALYLEYGLREAITVGGAFETSSPVGVSSGADSDVTLSGFARFRLHTGPQGDPFSAQVGYIAAADDALKGLSGAEGPRPDEVSREDEVDLRLLYGRGFSSALGPGWLGVEAGARLRLGESADEARLDLTAGVRPSDDWVVFAQAFGTLGLRNNEPFGADYDALKLAPSVGYVLSERATVVLGVEQDVAGRNIDDGTRVRLSLWLDF